MWKFSPILSSAKGFSPFEYAASCKYVCFGSKVIIYFFFSSSARTVFGRQNLTSKDGSRAERIITFGE